MPPPGRSLSLRPLVVLSAFAAGLVLPAIRAGGWPSILGAAGLPALLLPRGTRRRLLLPFGLGLALCGLHAARDPLPALLAGWSEHGFRPGQTVVTLVGEIQDSESLADGRRALVLRLERFEIPGPPPWGGRPTGAIRIRLTIAEPMAGTDVALSPGDRVETSARLGPPRSFRNPGGFDYGSYLRARGIDLTGTVKSPRLVTRLPGRKASLPAACFELRERVIRSLGAAGSGDEQTVSFLAALLVGERSALPPDFEEALIRSGVFHIVALSGFNIAVLSGLLLLLLRPLGAGPSARRAVVVAAIALYWGVARPGGSLDRAVGMGLLLLAGGLCGRKVTATGALASASMLMLAVNPFWIRDPGFQLSFAATLGLLLLGGGTVRRRDGVPGPAEPGLASRAANALGRSLAGSLRATAAALVATALISAWHFKILSPVALVANLFAAPIAAILLPAGLVIAALQGVSPSAAGALFAAARLLVGLLRHGTELCAAPSWCSFAVVPPPLWMVLPGPGALAVAAAGRNGVRRVAAAFLALSIVATAIAGRGRPAEGDLSLFGLDVGQGDSLLVRFPHGATLLVDAGGLARTPFDVGAKVVTPALRSLGVLRLDLLAITHAHRDHIGGALAVLRACAPRAIWLGRMPGDDPSVTRLLEEAARLGIPVVFPRRGVRVSMDGVGIDVLNPGEETQATGPARNDDSLVLRLRFGRRRALLTGDMEGPVETRLVAEGRGLDADLLKVGHHGSRTSTTEPFLERVRPAIAVISCGAGNPWGHPDPDVLERLRFAGVAIHRTDLEGAVAFATDGRSAWRGLPLGDGEPQTAGVLEDPR